MQISMETKVCAASCILLQPAHDETQKQTRLTAVLVNLTLLRLARRLAWSSTRTSKGTARTPTLTPSTKAAEQRSGPVPRVSMQTTLSLSARKPGSLLHSDDQMV